MTTFAIQKTNANNRKTIDAVKVNFNGSYLTFHDESGAIVYAIKHDFVVEWEVVPTEH